LVNKKSYTIWPQLPYFRFPGFEKIANSDIVVFNWPADTLYHMYRPADKRYEKPIDKKTNYVKRCVGIPGDNLSIKDGIVYINDKELQLPERAKPQYSYWLGYDGKTPIDFDFLLKDMKVTDGIFYVSSNRDSIGIKALTKENSERLKNIPGITSVTRMVRRGAEDGIYPDHQDGIVSKTNNWNCDNFGPIYIPKAGVTVALDLASLPLYKKIITEYEKGNVLKIVGNDIYINNKIVKSYTFQQNYYWMMGDNRHNSLDARYFGFTPEDHIVGKPVFIWMSWDSNGKGFGKIRWDRLFTTVGGDGQPTSYFKIFLILLALYIAIDYGIKKRNAKKNS